MEPLSEVGIRSGKLGGIVDLRCDQGGGLARALAAVPPGHGWHGGQNARGTSARKSGPCGVGCHRNWILRWMVYWYCDGGFGRGRIGHYRRGQWEPGRADEAGVALRRSMEFSLVWGLWLGPFFGWGQTQSAV